MALRPREAVVHLTCRADTNAAACLFLGPFPTNYQDIPSLTHFVSQKPTAMVFSERSGEVLMG